MTANSFAYNGFDTRVSKTDSGGTTTYKRAGTYVTGALLKSTVSSTTTDYTPGVSSRVTGTSTFDHAGLKNTDEQTDVSGDSSASRQYDAFGNVVSSYQTWAGPFGYGGAYGYQTDADHGLMLLGHRYYEADTGRFLTKDPIKDGRNWYGYCGNSPATRSDPRGLNYLVLAVVALQDRPTTLYGLFEKETGLFLKWGITSSPPRYTKIFLLDKDFREMATGPRKEMLAIERQLIRAHPGPLNRERWRGIGPAPTSDAAKSILSRLTERTNSGGGVAGILTIVAGLAAVPEAARSAITIRKRTNSAFGQPEITGEDDPDAANEAERRFRRRMGIIPDDWE